MVTRIGVVGWFLFVEQLLQTMLQVWPTIHFEKQYTLVRLCEVHQFVERRLNKREWGGERFAWEVWV